MDSKAFYNITYGVFMVATKTQDNVNGCITNTCIQVASNPTRIAVSCINANLTCEMIKESGEFNLSILDNTCTFETIKLFGLQSGRDVNKFELIKAPETDNGIPYLGWQTCAVLCCHVVESLDLGSHTLFICEVDDAFRLSDNVPLTYSDYQTKLKPKPQQDSKKEIIAWKCKICGFVYEGSTLPEEFTCPLCGHDAGDFEPIYKE